MRLISLVKECGISMLLMVFGLPLFALLLCSPLLVVTLISIGSFEGCLSFLLSLVSFIGCLILLLSPAFMFIGLQMFFEIMDTKKD